MLLINSPLPCSIKEIKIISISIKSCKKMNDIYLVIKNNNQSYITNSLKLYENKITFDFENCFNVYGDIEIICFEKSTKFHRIVFRYIFNSSMLKKLK
jgi:hypothetical protein